MMTIAIHVLVKIGEESEEETESKLDCSFFLDYSFNLIMSVNRVFLINCRDNLTLQ